MSFSSDAKKELCEILPENLCCKKAELAGLVAFSGTVLSKKEGGGLKLRTENQDVALRISALLTSTLSAEFPFQITEKKGEGAIYTLQIKDPQQVNHLTKALGFRQETGIKFRVDPFVTAESCCRRAFLRGAFLTAGSVTAPQKSYHLEIETHHRDLAWDLLQLFEDELLSARSVIRKSNYVIYMKDSEEIADALTALGATDSALELYHIKVEKDMKNKINRQVNCETANLTKTANTAAIHINAIQKVMSSPLCEELTPAQIELARLRLENPEASLSELTRLLTEPISKSGVSRRLNKIVQLAERLETRD